MEPIDQVSPDGQVPDPTQETPDQAAPDTTDFDDPLGLFSGIGVDTSVPEPTMPSLDAGDFDDPLGLFKGLQPNRTSSTPATDTTTPDPGVSDPRQKLVGYLGGKIRDRLLKPLGLAGAADTAVEKTGQSVQQQRLGTMSTGELVGQLQQRHRSRYEVKPSYLTGVGMRMTNRDEDIDYGAPLPPSEELRQRQEEAAFEKTLEGAGFAIAFRETMNAIRQTPMSEPTIQILEDPQSITSMSPKEIATATNELVWSSIIQTGASIGAGTLGTVLGGPGVGAFAAGATGFTVEYSNATPEAMVEIANEMYGERGEDETPYLDDNKFLIDFATGRLPNHEEYLTKVNKFALKRASAIAATDAASMYGIGKLSTTRLLARARALKVVLGSGIEAVGEGAGETAAQYVSKGEIDWGESLAETLAGFAFGAGSTVTQLPGQVSEARSERFRKDFGIDYQARAEEVANTTGVEVSAEDASTEEGAAAASEALDDAAQAAEEASEATGLPRPRMFSGKTDLDVLSDVARRADQAELQGMYQEYVNASMQSDPRFQVIEQELTRRAGRKVFKKSKTVDRLVNWVLDMDIQSIVKGEKGVYTVKQSSLTNEKLAEIEQMVSFDEVHPEQAIVLALDENGEEALTFTGIPAVRQWLDGEQVADNEIEKRPVGDSDLTPVSDEEQDAADLPEQPEDVEGEAENIPDPIDTFEEAGDTPIPRAVETARARYEASATRLTENDSPQQRAAVTRSERAMARAAVAEATSPEEATTFLTRSGLSNEEADARVNEVIEEEAASALDEFGDDFGDIDALRSELHEDVDGDPMFSIHGDGRKAKGTDLHSAVKAGKAVKKRRRHEDVPVFFVRNLEDLAKVDAVAARKASSQPGAKGFFLPSIGRGYVLTDNVSSVNEAVQTMTHEAVGHMGMRLAYGKNLSNTMVDVYDMVPQLYDEAKADRDAIENNRFSNVEDEAQRKALVAEEFIAKFSEQINESELSPRGISERVRALADTIAAGVRKEGRVLGFKPQFGRADAVSMIRNAKNVLANPFVMDNVSTRALLMSGVEEATEPETTGESLPEVQRRARTENLSVQPGDNGSLFREPASAYVPENPVPPGVDGEAFMENAKDIYNRENRMLREYRAHKEAYDVSVMAGVSRGDITPQQANELYDREDLSPPAALDQMESIPQRLYTVVEDTENGLVITPEDVSTPEVISVVPSPGAMGVREGRGYRLHSQDAVQIASVRDAEGNERAYKTSDQSARVISLMEDGDARGAVVVDGDDNILEASAGLREYRGRHLDEILDDTGYDAARSAPLFSLPDEESFEQTPFDDNFARASDIANAIRLDYPEFVPEGLDLDNPAHQAALDNFFKPVFDKYYRKPANISEQSAFYLPNTSIDKAGNVTAWYEPHIKRRVDLSDESITMGAAGMSAGIAMNVDREFGPGFTQSRLMSYIDNMRGGGDYSDVSSVILDAVTVGVPNFFNDSKGKAIEDKRLAQNLFRAIELFENGALDSQVDRFRMASEQGATAERPFYRPISMKPWVDADGDLVEGVIGERLFVLEDGEFRPAVDGDQDAELYKRFDMSSLQRRDVNLGYLALPFMRVISSMPSGKASYSPAEALGVVWNAFPGSASWAKRAVISQNGMRSLLPGDNSVKEAEKEVMSEVFVRASQRASSGTSKRVTPVRMMDLAISRERRISEERGWDQDFAHYTGSDQDSPLADLYAQRPASNRLEIAAENMAADITQERGAYRASVSDASAQQGDGEGFTGKTIVIDHSGKTEVDMAKVLGKYKGSDMVVILDDPQPDQTFFTQAVQIHLERDSKDLIDIVKNEAMDMASDIDADGAQPTFYLTQDGDGVIITVLIGPDNVNRFADDEAYMDGASDFAMEAVQAIGSLGHPDISLTKLTFKNVTAVRRKDYLSVAEENPEGVLADADREGREERQRRTLSLAEGVDEGTQEPLQAGAHTPLGSPETPIGGLTPNIPAVYEHQIESQDFRSWFGDWIDAPDRAGAMDPDTNKPAQFAGAAREDAVAHLYPSDRRGSRETLIGAGGVYLSDYRGRFGSAPTLPNKFYFRARNPIYLNTPQNGPFIKELTKLISSISGSDLRVDPTILKELSANDASAITPAMVLQAIVGVSNPRIGVETRAASAFRDALVQMGHDSAYMADPNSVAGEKFLFAAHNNQNIAVPLVSPNQVREIAPFSILSDVLNVDEKTLIENMDASASEAIRELYEIERSATLPYRAPDGSQSNMPPSIWLMTRTKAFKRKFGDWEKGPDNTRLVLHPNGEPEFVWHGTSSGSLFSYLRGNAGGTANPDARLGPHFAPAKGIALGFSMNSNAILADPKYFFKDKGKVGEVEYDPRTDFRIGDEIKSARTRSRMIPAFLLSDEVLDISKDQWRGEGSVPDYRSGGQFHSSEWHPDHMVVAAMIGQKATENMTDREIATFLYLDSDTGFASNRGGEISLGYRPWAEGDEDRAMISPDGIEALSETSKEIVAALEDVVSTINQAPDYESIYKALTTDYGETVREWAEHRARHTAIRRVDNAAPLTRENLLRFAMNESASVPLKRFVESNFRQWAKKRGVSVLQYVNTVEGRNSNVDHSSFIAINNEDVVSALTGDILHDAHTPHVLFSLDDTQGEFEASVRMPASTDLLDVVSPDVREMIQSQMDSVIEVRDEDGKLLAPNGERSNLSENRWKQVRTHFFKQWFGDWESDPQGASKVVDENGEPLVVYHGTQSDIYKFDTRYAKPGRAMGRGFYFTTSRQDAAKNYANIRSIERQAQIEEDASELVSIHENDPYLIDDIYGDGSLEDLEARVARREGSGTEFLAYEDFLRDQLGSDQKIISAFLNIRQPFEANLTMGKGSEFRADEFADALGRVINEGAYEVIRPDIFSIENIMQRAGYPVEERDMIPLSRMIGFRGLASELINDLSISVIDANNPDIYIGEELIYEAIAEMGYDGGMMPDPARRFPSLFENVRNSHDVVHFVTYRANSIKDADRNVGTFGQRVGKDKNHLPDPEAILFSVNDGADPVDSGMGAGRKPKNRQGFMRTPRGKQDPVTFYHVIDAIQRAIGTSVIRDRKVQARHRARIDKDTGAILTRDLSDLPAVGREVGRSLYRRFMNIEFDRIPKNEVGRIKSELEGLSVLEGETTSDAAHQDNGAAQFGRMWMYNVEDAKNRAPKYFEVFEKVLRDYHMAETMYEARDLIGAVGAKDAIGIMKHSVVPSRGVNPFLVEDQRTLRDRLVSKAAYYLTKWVDHGYPVKRAEADMLYHYRRNKIAETLVEANEEGWSDERLDNKLDEINTDDFRADEEAYTIWRLSNGSAGKASAYITHGISTLEGTNPITGEDGTTISLVEALAPVNFRISDFEHYAVARRAREIIDRINDPDDSLDNYTLPAYLNDDIIDDILAAYEEDPDIEGFKEAFDNLQEFNSGLIRLAQHEGLFSEEQADQILFLNQNYIPWQRLNPNVQTTAIGGRRSARVIANLRHGSEEPINKPLETLVAQTHKMVDAIERNRVMQALWDKMQALGPDNPAVQRWIRPASQTVAQREIRVRAENLINQLKNDPGVDQDALENTIENVGELNDLLIKISDPVYKQTGRTAMEGGEPQPSQLAPVVVDGEINFVEMPTELWESVMKFNRFQGSAIVGVLSKPATMLRRGATAWNPGFTVPNFVRDLVTRMFQSSRKADWRMMTEAFDPVILSLQYIGEQAGWSDAKVKGIYDEFKRSGAYGATFSAMDRNYFKDNALSVVAQTQGVKGVISHPWQVLEAMGAMESSVLGRSDTKAARVFRGAARSVRRVTVGTAERVNDTAENVNRITEYRAVYREVYDAQIKKGDTEQEARREASQRAALAARDVTIDFARMGQYMETINRLVPFSNAIMQGNVRVFESMANNPMRVLFASTLVIAVTAAIRGLSADNPWYDEQPEYIKDLYWTIPNYTGPVDQNGNPMSFNRIPKPHMWGMISGSLYERTFNWLKNNRPNEWQEYRRSLGGQLPIDPLAPFDERSTITQGMYNALDNMFGVQAVLPLVEVATGQDLFRHRPIEPYYMAQSREPSQRYDETDSPSMLLLSRWWEEATGNETLGPKMLEHLIYGYTAGLGKMVIESADVFAREGAKKKYDIDFPVTATDRNPGGFTDDVVEAVDAFFNDSPTEGLKKLSGLGYSAYEETRDPNAFDAVAMAPTRAVIRGFLADQPGYGAISVRDFFWMHNKATKKHETWMDRLMSESEESAAEYRERNDEWIRAYYLLKGYKPVVDAIGDAIKMTTSNYEEGIEDRKRLDRLYESLVRVSYAGSRGARGIMGEDLGDDIFANRDRAEEGDGEE